ncbi:nucleoside 2-deoxyribosyltransferase [Chryseobacterium sp. 1B4]
MAGPFFTVSERFLINEIYSILNGFDVDIFSPFHDAGIPVFKEDFEKIAKIDIDNLNNCDAVLAVISGNDPGTLFEVGYAKASGKKVILLCENYKENDLFMFKGTDCEITSDLSTAIYKVSW